MAFCDPFGAVLLRAHRLPPKERPTPWGSQRPQYQGSQNDQFSQPGGRGYFPLKQDPENRLLQGSDISWSAFQISCIKNSRKVKLRIIGFLGHFDLGLNQAVLIWLHNLILLHNRNVTLLRICVYISGGASKTSCIYTESRRGVGFSGKMGRKHACIKDVPILPAE